MMLNLRYNPTDKGILKGTQNKSNVSKLTYKDFSEKNFSYDFCVNKTLEILEKKH